MVGHKNIQKLTLSGTMKKGSDINKTAAGGNNSTGPSCSKLTMSLVNDSLKFTSSDTQIC